MTALIAINLGEIAIIAADKKVVEIFDDMIIPVHEDAEKLIDVGIGLMTGSGFVSLLEEVKRTIAVEPIEHTDQILSIIQEARKAFTEKSNIGQKHVDHMLEKTGWLFTYRTPLENHSTLRVALYHPSISVDHLSIIYENIAKIIFPSDIDPSRIEYFTRYLSDNVSTLDGGVVKDVITNNIELILEIFSELEKLSESVSSVIDIGLVSSSGEKYMARSISRNSDAFSFECLSS